MSTPADRIAAKFAAAAVKIASYFHEADYVALHKTEVRTSSGMNDVYTPGEIGKCSLSVSGQQGGITITADVLRGMATYELELPIGTTIKVDDKIDITARLRNETRRFRITSPPVRGDGMEMFTRCGVEVDE